MSRKLSSASYFCLSRCKIKEILAKYSMLVAYQKNEKRKKNCYWDPFFCQQWTRLILIDLVDYMPCGRICIGF